MVRVTLAALPRRLPEQVTTPLLCTQVKLPLAIIPTNVSCEGSVIFTTTLRAGPPRGGTSHVWVSGFHSPRSPSLYRTTLKGMTPSPNGHPKYPAPLVSWLDQVCRSGRLSYA